jgi:hypothetical protein
MTKIGLLSDTHGDLPEQVFHYFADVDEIWHAGDIGDLAVTDRLKAFKPLRGVYGNIDDHVIRQEFPEFNRFRIEGVDVLMTHIGGRPGKYSKPAHDALLQSVPKLFVCGHSHILLVRNDPRLGMLCMNPGACGNKGFHKMRTLLRFGIDGERIVGLEAIEIGKRAEAGL